MAAPLVIAEVHLMAGLYIECGARAGEFPVAAVVFFCALLREGHGIGVVRRGYKVAVPWLAAVFFQATAAVFNEFHGGRQRKALYRGEPDGHGDRYFLA